MGSRCTIVLYASSEPAAARAAAAAFDQIAHAQRVLTDYDPNSEAMRLTAQPPDVWHEVSATLLQVLIRAEDIHNRTLGAFDPTVGAYTHLWREAKKQARAPTPNELRAASKRVGFMHIQVDPARSAVRFDTPGIVLDFGAIGKGYAAQLALDSLRDAGFPSAMIDMGGDLALGDAPPDQPQGWRVRIITGLSASEERTLTNCAVATSGDLERYYEHEGVRYSHILDPRTGMGVAQRRAATAIAPDAALADALASAISVLGEAHASALRAEFPGVEITLVTRALGDE